jgi:hypothetical protein
MTKWLTRGHMRRHMDGSARADTYGTRRAWKLEPSFYLSLETLSSSALPTSRFLTAPEWRFARPRLFGREGDASAYYEYILFFLLLPLNPLSSAGAGEGRGKQYCCEVRYSEKHIHEKSLFIGTVALNIIHLPNNTQLLFI